MTTAEPRRLRVPLMSEGRHQGPRRQGRQAVTETTAYLWEPAANAPAGCGVLLGHGAGSNAEHPALHALGRALARQGHPVAVFNFPYAEAGRRRPDPTPQLERAFRDAAAALRGRLGGREPVLGGRSMGGRIASHLAAQGEPCAGLLLLGYPLHPRPLTGATPDERRLRTAHWSAIDVPALFVQGDRDALCDLALFGRERRRRLHGRDVTLHAVRGADHGFAVRRRDGRTPEDVEAEIVGTVAGWLARLRLPADPLVPADGLPADPLVPADGLPADPLVPADGLPADPSAPADPLLPVHRALS